MSLHMLLSFLKIMALNSSSVNLLNCTSFISSSVEVSCSFIWLFCLFVCFCFLPFWLSQWALESAKFSLWVLVFCCLWLPLLGLDEAGRTHFKHHCQILAFLVSVASPGNGSYLLAFFAWRLLVEVT
uniref:Uncharacterized protein n=1 Tax=Molossus molossus TaxID=27622 RepID=A0A7J8E345_MOLMO|nr:hypothetical protein HJG59_009025 [Molossus molossus]